MKLIEAIEAAAPAIAELRKRLHARPELSFEEHHTASLIVATLQSWGIEVHYGLAGTGVVGVIRNGTSARAVGLRADMDALPMEEQNTFAHASVHPGKMHGCGHDGHVAMLLAAAQYLARHRHFDGTVYLIFQPAEEDGAGGRVMIKDGLFERFPMDAVFGLHNWPELPAGTMAVSPGPVMASCSDFHLHIQGKGNHAAMPHLSVDPLPIACQIVLGWQTIVSRNRNPFDVAALSVTTINAGQASNVIPENCSLSGTVRTFDHQVTRLIEQRMRELAEHTCAAYGASCRFEFVHTYVPTVNHAQEAELARAVMSDILGEQHVLAQQPSLASEDFGYMLQQKPGAYAFIANGNGSHRLHGHGLGACELHNPSYDFNDDIISLGATYWVRLAERYLSDA